MDLQFAKSQNTNAFFSILPLDWQEIIIPLWPKHQGSSTIYVIEHDQAIIAGGIVFSKTPPYATALEISYDYLFKRNYLYLGFIFVLPEYRGKNIASKWLYELKKTYSQCSFWLTIEELNLKSFYEKNGFKLIDSNINLNAAEWVMVSE